MAMTRQALFNAVVGLAMMGALTVAYVALARRYRSLWHPASVVLAVTVVGIAVSVVGVALFGSGLAEVPAMLRRSAIGSFGWGLVIAAGVWAARRGYTLWINRR